MPNLAEKRGAEVLDFQEAGVFRGGFVDAERAHDAERCGTFQWADEASAAIQEMRLFRPGRIWAAFRK